MGDRETVKGCEQRSFSWLAWRRGQRRLKGKQRRELGRRLQSNKIIKLRNDDGLNQVGFTLDT